MPSTTETPVDHNGQQCKLWTLSNGAVGYEIRDYGVGHVFGDWTREQAEQVHAALGRLLSLT